MLGESANHVLEALALREIACIEKFPAFLRECQQGFFGGPEGYHPTKQAKLSVLHDFLKICLHVIPKDDTISAGINWHNDLHMDNIFVDTADPTQITSIIDWQAVPIYVPSSAPPIIDRI